MTPRPVLAILLALVLFTARAQTPLGQPSLDESKVQMWCATVRFVYDAAAGPTSKAPCAARPETSMRWGHW